VSFGSGVLASGVFVAVLPLGLIATRVLAPMHPRDSFSLATPLGIAAISIPLAVAAALGHFDAAWNGAAGWCVAIIAMTMIIGRPGRVLPDDLRATPRRDWQALAILALAGIVYTLGVVETPIGSRDEGLYTLAGLALGRAGRIAIAAPDLLGSASRLFEPFVSGIAFFLPGIPAAAHLRPQFPPVLPAWIAQMHAVGGDMLLYRFNVIAVVASGAVFHALARRVMRQPFAWMALIVFAFNPAQVWIARINLAEPLGALFALSGLLVVLQRENAGRPMHASIAIGLFTLAALVRIDLILVAPLLTFTALACVLVPRARPASVAVLRLGAFTLVAQCGALALLASWSLPYIVDHLRFLLMAPAASVAGMLFYPLLARLVLDAKPAVRWRIGLAAATCVVLASLFVYAGVVRPFVEPFALIADRGSILAGTRDYREESLWNVAAYLGWPTLVLALVGTLAVVHRSLRGRADAPIVIICALAIGSSVVYLTAPTVSPDHPWSIRRMMTLVFPMLILMAGVGLQGVLHAAMGWRHFRIPLIVGCGALVALLVVQKNTLMFSENAGVTAALRAVDERLDDGLIIVRGFEGLATTFALGFGRNVLPLRDEFVAVDKASRAFWETCARRACTLLHASIEGLDGLALAPLAATHLSREYVEPAVRPLAHNHARETLQFMVSRVEGITTRGPPSNAGAARDWRLEDAGFYRDELASGMVARWTDGAARLMLPASTADRVELRFASAAPAAQSLRIELDGTSVFDGTVRPGETRFDFPLRPDAKAHPLTIASSTFVPGDAFGGMDRRTLGVSLRAVRLLRAEATRLSSQSPAGDFRASVTVWPPTAQLLDRAQGPVTLRADIDNLGAASWGASVDLARGSAAVALGLYWTRAGDSHRLIEQRIPLPYSLAPGEHWTTPVIVDLAKEPMAGWPAGAYELHVRLVLEGVVWFPEHAAGDVTIPITIAPPRS